MKAVGLSPRLRGNPTRSVGRLHLGGSIPAPAGEPTLTKTHPSNSRVYPRACGGTSPNRLAGRTIMGLSPRLRGNLGTGQALSLASRSIPAPAGEPPSGVGGLGILSVYPRACGGTGVWSPRAGCTAGLSPRLRGNPSPPYSGWCPTGSIPAPAGEPAPGSEPRW